ncbi:MAG: cupin [Granulosicoccus sp.]|nr:cupin [Granulosicoccus sp.]
MEINADFSRRSLLHTPDIQWQDSPMQGVRRRILDRVGNELARATSIVSYAPASHFPAHAHPGGEEFIVLEGVFQDEHGDYPAGTYVRNPPESSHTPRSDEGCLIFVKLWQFDKDDRHHVVSDMNKVLLQIDASRPGTRMHTLFENSRESVRLESWEPGADVVLDTSGGAELLILDGAFTDAGEKLEKLSWLRIPINGTFSATPGPQGARVWVKTGHLRFAEEEKRQMSR